MQPHAKGQIVKMNKWYLCAQLVNSITAIIKQITTMKT